MLEAWSEVDKDLAELNGNTSAFRLSEAQSFIEAMNIEMAQTLFYGNSSLDPEEFTGFSVRYSDTTAGNGQNIVLGGSAVGQTDNMSIWLVVWGPNTVHGIFPKGSKAGLIHEDLGLVTVETSAGIVGTRMRAYQDRWQWKCGIALKDWRYAVRIPNIDLSLLIAGGAPAAVLTDLMIKALHRIPNLNGGSPVFYMNRTIFQYLDIQRLTAVTAGGGLTYDNVDGKIIPKFRQVPIRLVDALTENEARVA